MSEAHISGAWGGTGLNLAFSQGKWICQECLPRVVLKHPFLPITEMGACLHQEMAFERPVCKPSSVMLALSEARACAGSSGQLCNSICPRELEPGPYKYDTNPAFHRRWFATVNKPTLGKKQNFEMDVLSPFWQRFSSLKSLSSNLNRKHILLPKSFLKN